jgi:hypothetical protein
MRIAACVVIAVLSGSTALAVAQTQPAPAPKPAATAAKPAATAPARTAPSDQSAKAAKSKECSVQADQKGLHGKARKKFRDECKKS